MHISELSNRQLAGQRLMVGFDGTRLNADLRHLINTLMVGGIILFTRNITGPEQLQKLCLSIQEYGRQTGIPPLFIAIDQEGGQVARLKEPFTQFSGAAQLKKAEDARRFARITAYELNAVGINMNMAPVMDVALEKARSIMADRSFGSDPNQVSRIGIQIITRLQQDKIMAVAKHFPGIGRTTLDSHLDMPTLGVDIDTLVATDIIPFQDAISHKVAGIMLSHIFYDRIDPNWPASLSPVIARDILRDGMGYDGVVMTDDLDMGAIKKNYTIQEVMSQILSADIDIALLCHKSPDIEIAHEEILTSIRDSIDLRTRCKASVERILKLKERYLGSQEVRDLEI